MAGPRSDAELLRARDAEAFGQIYDRHAAHLHRRIRQAGVPAADTRDLLAETFAQAWLCRRRFRDPGDGSAYPWLAGIARNLVRNYFRSAAVEARARRRIGLELPTVRPDEVEPSGDGPAARALLEAVREPARRAVELRVIEGLAYREVAARLGCTPETARKRVSLALREMRLAAEDRP